MTAAGSSLPDAFHQATDAVSYAIGLSGDDQKDEPQGPTGEETVSQNGAGTGPAGSQGEEQKSWLSGWIPSWSGPGNHPNDPASQANRPYYQDTVGKPDAGHDHEESRADESTANDAPRTERQQDIKDDVLARALASRPKATGHRDDEQDHHHRQADPRAVDGSEALSKSNPVDETRHSTANDREERDRHPEAYPDKPQHEEHPAHRGPMWASRPDDAQRAKIREMKNKRHQEDKEARKRATGRSESEGRHSFGKAGDGEGRNQDGESPDATAPRPPTERNNSRLSTLFSGHGRKKSPRTPSATSSGADTKDDELARRGLRGVFGQQADGDGDAKQSEIPQQDSQAKGKEDGAAAEGTSGVSDSTDDGQTTAKPTKGSPAPESEEAKLSKVSGLLLGRPPAPEAKPGEMSSSNANEKWAILKQRVQATGAVAKRRNDKRKEESRKRVLGGLDMTAELQSGILPVIMLKMALERDESGHRRVPVLLNHLRLKITDSVNPLHSSQAVFRIELSYADDVLKWVVYRSLGDFLTLHAHYRAAALRGYLGRAVGDSGNADGEVGLPRFPKTSLPYLRQLQSQGRMRGEDGRKLFARFQRDAIEDYTVELIKRVMFRPEANRLCKFLELSALGISLATRGGFSGKQGYLRVLSKGGRKQEQKSVLSPASWLHAAEPKWFIVRESYIAICPGPETLEVHDVFLVDGEFRVERPKRIYKQAAHLATELKGGDSGDQEKTGSAENGAADGQKPDQIALLTNGQFKEGEQKRGDLRGAANTNVSSHTFYIYNAERKLKLSAKSDRILEQFVASMERVALQSPFSGSNRFGSFAPIRLNVNAQWLIDGRDYFWELSRALLLAKDRIMIHDWWLSPELYLRRPGEPKWRLDNILKKKAEEGVKVFVILYNEVSNNFTPTDSGYSKQRLTALHPNIYVQRSPSHFQTGTFYWAHHEKMCAIDETIAFMGGLDLCFGRYDTPAHVLTDDVDADYHSKSDNSASAKQQTQLLGPATEDGKEAHIWPGQDYANERVAEWSDLTKPAQDLFDRTRFPRMPWHDTGLQLIGQPARDLCRHFTQRWNYLLRNKNHKRKFPFLVPAPDFTAEELERYQITGTCEAQICRSAGPWSLGTSKTVEHSIQNAYLKCIQMSDHFVYIENQFFVTSTEVEGTVIENNIGNALVSRIIRAHREGTLWRAIIVIPLIPGFPMPISEPDASSVRIICDTQFRSICRGEHSIFGKLRREGIDPDQYISFFSLRGWGKFRGGQLTTEQVYIHGKCAVFDDRIAIIGSANINERSQRGDRDSELACVIRDTDMIDSTMAGRPYKVGRFAHTMRIRLMREHLGVDVDALEQEEQDENLKELRRQQHERPRKGTSDEHADEDGQAEVDTTSAWDPDHEQRRGVDEAEEGNVTKVASRHRIQNLGNHAALAVKDSSTGAKNQIKNYLDDPKDTLEEGKNPAARAKEAGIEEDGEVSDSEADVEAFQDEEKRDDNLNELLEHRQKDAKDGSVERPEDSAGAGVKGQTRPEDSEARHKEGLSTTVEERLLVEASDDYGSEDRHRRAVSENPEDEVHQRLGNDRHRMNESASAPILDARGQREEARRRINAHMSANPWAPPLSVPEIDPHAFTDPVCDSFYKDMWLAVAVHNTQIYRKVFRCVPDDTVTTWSEYKAFMAWGDRLAKSGKFSRKEDREARQDVPPEARGPGSQLKGSTAGSTRGSASDRDKDSRNPHDAAPSPPDTAVGPDHQGNGGAPQQEGAFSDRELEQMEALLDETVGHLVIFPTRFLETEDRSRNFLFPLDVIQPMAIFA
ncbi:unnamed protein product [Parajaminaea phylloscopi]